MEVIVLLTYKEGLSLKPYDIKEAVKVYGKLGYSKKEVRAPEFCFASMKRTKIHLGMSHTFSTNEYEDALMRWIRGLDKYEDVYSFREHIFKSVGGNASCGHV